MHGEKKKKDFHLERFYQQKHILLLRIGVFLLILLSLQCFIASIPLRVYQLTEVASEVQRPLQHLGLSAHILISYIVGLDCILVMLCSSISFFLFFRIKENRCALIMSLMLMIYGAIWITRPQDVVSTLPYPSSIIIVSLRTLGNSLVLLACYIFPDGRFIPRWTIIPAILYCILNFLWLLFPSLPLNIIYHFPNEISPSSLPTFGVLVLWLLSGFCIQIYRYRYRANRIEKQQTRWVVFGIFMALVGYVLFKTAPFFFPFFINMQYFHLLYIFVGVTIFYLFLLCVPVSIGFSILKYRLWMIDTIINRTIVYLVLTISIATLYFLLIFIIGLPFHSYNNIFTPSLSTIIISFIFFPVRNFLQKKIDHIMYGEKNDPYKVLTRLGKRLEATLAPEDALYTILETVSHALKIPYSAIALKNETDFSIVQSYGRVSENYDMEHMLQLRYQNETIGYLLLASHDSNDHFSSFDMRLLDDFTRQASVVVHAVQLTRALELSRERLVIAREEERRRLRRDLHDGLGPILSSLTLKVGAARVMLFAETNTADALLEEFEKDLSVCITEIRRLIYNLRPPSLEDNGLYTALQQCVLQYNDLISKTAEIKIYSHKLAISMEMPETLPPLSAATEVAIYRIVNEAIANVVRHAQAKHCTIKLSLSEQLHLEITDDGIGLPPKPRKGIGLISMKERASELGGLCQVVSIPSEGTRVLCTFPLPEKRENSVQYKVPIIEGTKTGDVSWK